MRKNRLSALISPGGHAIERLTEEEFAALYENDLPRLVNFIRYRVQDEALVEDLTSQAYEKAWKNRDSFNRAKSTFRTWVFNIAKNTIRDHFRRKHVKAEQPLTRSGYEKYMASSSPEEEVESVQELAKLDDLLKNLDSRDRELISLKFGAGLSNSEIGEIMGISVSNVSTILHRIMLILRKQWDGEEK